MSDKSVVSVALPAELKVGKFAEARVKEILELRSTIGESLSMKNSQLKGTFFNSCRRDLFCVQILKSYKINTRGTLLV